MNPQKWQRLIGILLLLISLAILIWGIWPYADLTRSTPVQPADMQLPTPESFLWMVINLI